MTQRRSDAIFLSFIETASSSALLLSDEGLVGSEWREHAGLGHLDASAWGSRGAASGGVAAGGAGTAGSARAAGSAGACTGGLAAGGCIGVEHLGLGVLAGRVLLLLLLADEEDDDEQQKATTSGSDGDDGETGSCRFSRASVARRDFCSIGANRYTLSLGTSLSSGSGNAVV